MVSIRIAQAAIALFAIGHTLGMLSSRMRDDAERAALEGLKAYRFAIMGVERSHHDFYLGMGWSLSLFLVFALLLTQWLLPLMQAQPAMTRPILWGMAGVFAVMTVFCMRWFFPAPLGMSLVASLALAWAAWHT